MAPSTLPHASKSPTPEAVLAYCEAGHTNAQAAAHFGCSDRYIRKLKSKARSDSEAQTPLEAPQQPVVPSRASVAPSQPSRPPTHSYATVAAHDVARDGVLWKCPVCGELMPPLPGTTGATWAVEGCYLHQVKAPFQAGQEEHLTGTVPSDVDEQEEQDWPPELEEVRPSLDVPGRNTEYAAAPAGGTGPGEQTPIIVRERVIERVVYRVPVERPTSPTLAWAREHLPPVQVLVAFLITALLVGVASLG